MTPERKTPMTDIHAAAKAKAERMIEAYEGMIAILPVLASDGANDMLADMVEVARAYLAILKDPMLLLKPPVWVESKPTYWETVWAWDTGVGVAYSIVHREDSPLYRVFGFAVGFDSLEAAQAACWQDYCGRMKGAFVSNLGEE